MSKRNKVRSARSRGPLLGASLEARVLVRLLLRDQHRKLVDARINEFRQKAAYLSELSPKKSGTETTEVYIDWSKGEEEKL